MGEGVHRVGGESRGGGGNQDSLEMGHKTIFLVDYRVKGT